MVNLKMVLLLSNIIIHGSQSIIFKNMEKVAESDHFVIVEKQVHIAELNRTLYSLAERIKFRLTHMNNNSEAMSLNPPLESRSSGEHVSFAYVFHFEIRHLYCTLPVQL